MKSPLSYKLTSMGRFKGGYADATLFSELLNRTLHPSGSVCVRVAGQPSQKPPGYVLDEFSARSLETYLKSQLDIKSALEEKLLADQIAWGAKPLLRGKKVWGEAEIKVVAFERKHVPMEEGLKKLETAHAKNRHQADSRRRGPARNPNALHDTAERRLG